MESFNDFEPTRPPPEIADEVERADILAMLPAVVEVVCDRSDRNLVGAAR